MRRRVLSFIVVSVLAVMMWSGAAMAYETGIYELGFVVPLATYDGAGMDTVVGIDLGDTPPTSSSAIYWSYMSVNGVQLSSGSINITSGFFTFPFSLANADGGANPGVRGWLIFTWDDNGTLEVPPAMALTINLVAGNAFLLDLSANDAAFIPVIPLVRSDYQTGPIPLNNLPPNVLTGMSHGVNPAANNMMVRFTNDPAILGETELYIFTPTNAPAVFVALAVGDSGVTTSNFNLASTGTRLNSFNLGSVTELSGIANGTINISDPAIGIAFGLSSSSVLGAAQTTVVNAQP